MKSYRPFLTAKPRSMSPASPEAIRMVSVIFTVENIAKIPVAVFDSGVVVVRPELSI
ncbi:MAG: hypothetical protein LBT89_00075 [Planctomycetaceae bacterium]|nr:hypothetical protein [Planctomycetaceae bacterium]